MANYTLPTNLFGGECPGGPLYCMAEWANTATSGFFWPAMLFAFVAIIFMATQRFGTSRSFGYSSAIGLLAAIWLATLQLMAWWIATLFILFGVIGFATLVLNER